METKQFKDIFNLIAQENGFEYIFGGWFKESEECIVVLELQKSNYGNYCDLNVKTYIHGVFGVQYKKNKDLVKKDVGDLFTRQPNEFNDVFDLDNSLDVIQRAKRLRNLFSEFIVPETSKTLTRSGIKELAAKGEYILPAIKKELGIQ